MISKFVILFVLACTLLEDPVAESKPIQRQDVMLERYSVLSSDESEVFENLSREIEDVPEDLLRTRESRYAGAQLTSEEVLRQARRERNRALLGGKPPKAGDAFENGRSAAKYAREGEVKQGDDYGNRRKVAKKTTNLSPEVEFENVSEEEGTDNLRGFAKYGQKRMEKKTNFLPELEQNEESQDYLKRMKSNVPRDDAEVYGSKSTAGKKPRSKPQIRQRDQSMFDDVEDVGDDSFAKDRADVAKLRSNSRVAEVRGLAAATPFTKPRQTPQPEKEYSTLRSSGFRSETGDKVSSRKDGRQAVKEQVFELEELLDEVEQEGQFNRGTKYGSDPKQYEELKKELTDDILFNLRNKVKQELKAELKYELRKSP